MNSLKEQVLLHYLANLGIQVCTCTPSSVTVSESYDVKYFKEKKIRKKLVTYTVDGNKISSDYCTTNQRTHDSHIFFGDINDRHWLKLGTSGHIYRIRILFWRKWFMINLGLWCFSSPSQSSLLYFFLNIAQSSKYVLLRSNQKLCNCKQSNITLQLATRVH